MISTASDPILTVRNLYFAYPGQPPLVSGWSTSIGAGVTHLYGDDGSGKSTLLRLLAGRLSAKGEFTLAGVKSQPDLNDYQRSVFFVDTANDDFSHITALECSQQLRQGDDLFDEAQWQTCVEAFSLTPHLTKQMYMLSTGSKRKVWLASALASGRMLTLLDEPAAALDAVSVRFLWTTLAKLSRQPGRAIIVASAAPIDACPLTATLELAPRTS